MRLARRVLRRGALLIALLALACSESPPTASEQAPQPVRTASVRRATGAAPVRATGTIGGKEEARLSFKIPGYVERLLVDEGAVVVSAQLLATLKQEEASSRVTQARMAHEKARRDVARAEELHAAGVAPLRLVQDAQTQEEVARAGLAMARFDAQHAEIRAPSDGVILARLAEQNEMVAAGTPVLAFKAAAEGWIARVGVADRDVVRLQLGDTATVWTNAYPEHPLAGRVAQIAAAAAPATGTFDVEIAIAPDDVALFSGISARVEIAPRSAEPLAFVPLAALAAGDGDRAVVFTLDGDGARALRREVRVAFLAGDEAALRGGADGLERVITDGVAWLRDGSPVRVVAPELAEAR
jgi:RND family efflux transporter MFP subunit